MFALCTLAVQWIVEKKSVLGVAQVWPEIACAVHDRVLCKRAVQPAMSKHYERIVLAIAEATNAWKNRSGCCRSQHVAPVTILLRGCILHDK